MSTLFSPGRQTCSGRLHATQDIRQTYRELDAPLARDLIGIGRTIAGLPALPVDWDWSKSWDANQAAGALPGARLLLVARLSVAILFPFSLFFIFKSGQALGGSPLGWLAMLLLAANPLVLLHTRRAMAESGLIFTITLFLWALTRPVRPAWLIAIPAALVFCSKQSAGVLALVGLLFVLWQGWQQKHTFSRQLLDATLFGLVFVALVGLLNPFLWSNPIQAFQAAIHARQNLTGNQVAALGAVRPDLLLGSLSQRLLGLAAQLFITRPAVADIGNYVAQTKSAAAAYFSNPFNQLLGGLIGGGILLVLSFSGFCPGRRQFNQDPRSLQPVDPVIPAQHPADFHHPGLVPAHPLAAVLPAPGALHLPVGGLHSFEGDFADNNSAHIIRQTDKQS